MTEVVRLPTAVRSGNNEELWPTTTTHGFRDVFELARIMGQIAIITGPSGIGKTTAARAALKAASTAAIAVDVLDAPELVFVSMTRAAARIQPGLLRIAAAAGITVSNHMGANDAHDALVQHVWGEGSLLVIDEAQFASDDLLDAVRNVWDDLSQAGTGLAIVLIGTLDLAKRLKGLGSKGSGFEPLRGRAGAWLELDTPEPEDCTAICRHHGLNDKSSEALIRRAAGLGGGLHNVKRIIAQAERAVRPGERLTFANLKQAAELAGVSS